MTLGTRIIGFIPSFYTTALYVYGGLVALFGFFLGWRLANYLWFKRRGKKDNSIVKLIKSMLTFLDKFQIDLFFLLFLAGYLISLAFNLFQIYKLGKIPLFDIASRWKESPVLVWFATWQILFVPGLIVTSKTRWQKFIAFASFFVSTVALGLLGARNLPAKLVIAFFLALVYLIKPKQIPKIIGAFLVILIFILGLVGAISKSGIYGPVASAELALGLTYSDSVGAVYNLERIVNISTLWGVYRGKLAFDSFMALIPGTPYEYANYQIGKMLGGRQTFQFGEEIIERSVSLAPTLIGAAYADFGFFGVIIQMLLIGFLFGYYHFVSKKNLLFVPFLVTYSAYVINGIDAGIHNPHTILIFGLVLTLLFLDVVLKIDWGRRDFK